MHTARVAALAIGACAAGTMAFGILNARSDSTSVDMPSGSSLPVASPAESLSPTASDGSVAATDTSPSVTAAPSTVAAALPPTTPWVPDPNVVSDPTGFGRPYPKATTPGLLTFRGNLTRSWYGTGPMPKQPSVAWSYPDQAMCGESSEYNQIRVWCGTGWTMQPAVFERDGRTWVVFGAYDHKIHFVDAATGQAILPPFKTGDIAKGNVTVDPDGFPLIYHGSRDNKFRVIAIDGTEARELWSMDGQTLGERKWNNDWDAAALIVNDYLVEGGENSRLHLVKLNRGYDADGSVSANPDLVWSAPAWDQQLISDLGAKDPSKVSLESSVMLLGDTLWVNSSGGLLQGWDFSILRTGQGTPKRTFRYWAGDDCDSTVVGDPEGFLYVGCQIDRGNRRGTAVGQMFKVDPRKPDDPVVWKVDANQGAGSGTWSTPAIVGDVVIWPVKQGSVYGLDRATGAELWRLALDWGMMSSPVVVDSVLIQASSQGVLHAYDVSNPRVAPVPLWQVQLPANIESTPAVWKGRIYVGTREGHMHAVGDVG